MPMMSARAVSAWLEYRRCRSWNGRNGHFGRLFRRPGAWPLSAAVALSGALPVAVGLAGPASPTGQPSVVLCSGYARCDAHDRTNHGYPAHARTSYWRMTAGNECTNYVAYVESQALRAATPRYLLGNAGQWPATARAHGVLVNHVPSVGAVAEWDGGAAGMGPLGHVAVVEAVGPRDRYIVISQQHMSYDRNGYDWTRINAGYAADRWQEWPDHFIHFRVPATAAVGYYDPSSGSWRLQTTLGQAAPLIAFGQAARGVIPLTGDWTGRGSAGAGYYNPRTAWFHVRDWAGRGADSASFTFGPPGMIPLVGNWDGRGGDGVGYYDPATGTFYLRNRLSSGPADYTIRFGPPGMVPLAGDWTGSGRSGIGYYNPANGSFHLRQQLSAGPPRDVFRFGIRGLVPVVGSWTGGRADGIGLYNPRTGWFYLRDRLSAGPATLSFPFGPRGMTPLAGRWTA
jgi:surface antigen